MSNRALAWFQRLPPWGLALLGVLLAGAVVGGGVAGYRTYTYVEHDNEFCLSCHLMEEPFDRFAQSEHRGLGCKACHKPTFAARSQMALTQIIENPDSLAAHAEVPNEKCAGCHVEGDPERWESIRSSAGHRIHLESDDPSLQGLNCVECHSTGVHEFAAVDRTCAQSGCHTDSDVQLGGMSDLTIHCVACHGFSTPVEPGEPEGALAAAVTPDSETCLSCHAMRTLVDMPPDEPHEQACGLCHNPHEQATPEQAVESCATSGCHSDAAELTPMHRGLDPGVLEACGTCHEAHDWTLEAENCVACHQDVFQSAGGVAARSLAAALVPHGPVETMRWPSATGPGALGARFAVEAHPAASGTGGRAMEVRLASLARQGLAHGPASPPGGVSDLEGVHAGADATGPVGRDGAALRQVRPDSVFRHADHRDVGCLTCHSTENAHGQVEVTTLTDCRSCHHTAPVSADCTACHEAGAPAGSYALPRTVSFTVRDPLERALPFEHTPHEEIGCGRCHTEGLVRSAASVDCVSCHEDHHRPEGVRCASCHEPAPVEAHPPQRVHVGCSGAGCHSAVPVDGIPRTREFCLTCHQDQEDHRVGRNCAECHQIPGGLSGERP